MGKFHFSSSNLVTKSFSIPHVSFSSIYVPQLSFFHQLLSLRLYFREWLTAAAFGGKKSIFGAKLLFFFSSATVFHPISADFIQFLAYKKKKKSLPIMNSINEINSSSNGNSLCSRKDFLKENVYCGCGYKLPLKTSWTSINPGRRFFACPNY